MTIHFGPARVFFDAGGRCIEITGMLADAGYQQQDPFCWSPGGREFADRWADMPTGLEAAARRAVERWRFWQTARTWATWMAQTRIAAQVVDPRAFIRITGI